MHTVMQRVEYGECCACCRQLHRPPLFCGSLQRVFRIHPAGDNTALIDSQHRPATGFSHPDCTGWGDRHGARPGQRSLAGLCFQPAQAHVIKTGMAAGVLQAHITGSPGQRFGIAHALAIHEKGVGFSVRIHQQPDLMPGGIQHVHRRFHHAHRLVIAVQKIAHQHLPAVETQHVGVIGAVVSLAEKEKAGAGVISGKAATDAKFERAIHPDWQHETGVVVSGDFTHMSGIRQPKSFGGVPEFRLRGQSRHDSGEIILKQGLCENGNRPQKTCNHVPNEPETEIHHFTGRCLMKPEFIV